MGLAIGEPDKQHGHPAAEESLIGLCQNQTRNLP